MGYQLRSWMISDYSLKKHFILVWPSVMIEEKQ